MRKIFISGTDTNSGKTIVTAGIYYALKRQYPNLKIGLCKPFESGCKNGICPDREFIYEFNENCVLPKNKKLFNFNCFELAASIHLAAQTEKKKIDILKAKKFINELGHSLKLDILLIEGAGGLAVPLSKNYLIIDFISFIKAELILVCGNKLGCLNHCFLSYSLIKAKSIPFLGTISNNLEKESIITKDNSKMINIICEETLKLKIPYFSPKNFKKMKSYFLSCNYDFIIKCPQN